MTISNSVNYLEEPSRAGKRSEEIVTGYMHVAAHCRSETFLAKSTRVVLARVFGYLLAAKRFYNFSTYEPF